MSVIRLSVGKSHRSRVLPVLSCSPFALFLPFSPVLSRSLPHSPQRTKKPQLHDDDDGMGTLVRTSAATLAKAAPFDGGVVWVGQFLPGGGNAVKKVELPREGLYVGSTPANEQGKGWEDTFDCKVTGAQLEVWRTDVYKDENGHDVIRGGWGQHLELNWSESPPPGSKVRQLRHRVCGDGWW